MERGNRGFPSPPSTRAPFSDMIRINLTRGCHSIEVLHPYEWLTCFGGPPGLHGEYGREVEST